jgi:hypothetical protein
LTAALAQVRVTYIVFMEDSILSPQTSLLITHYHMF